LYFNSCSEKKDVINPQQIDFYEEKMNLVNGLTSQDVADYLNYDVHTFSKNVRESVPNEIDWSKVPSDYFQRVLKETIEKYPDMRKENFTDDEFEFFKKAFPEFKDKQEAFVSKKHIVVDYLEIIIGKEIKKEIKNYLQKNKNLKPSNLQSYQANYNSLNPTEQSVSSNHPLGANDVNKARTQAMAYFGTHNDNTITNAKFHAFWSAGMVKEICHTTLNKWKGLDRGKKFATAHEYDTNNIQNCAFVANHTAVFNVRNYGLCNYMDLNNNLIGRTYMFNTVGQTWLGNANNIPSYATIYSHVNSLNSSLKNTVNGIISINPSYTLDNLGHYLNAMDYFTPTAGQLVHVAP